MPNDPKDPNDKKRRKNLATPKKAEKQRRQSTEERARYIREMDEEVGGSLLKEQIQIEIKKRKLDGTLGQPRGQTADRKTPVAKLMRQALDPKTPKA